LALIVRVVSSWTAVSPRSKWIRWSFILTEWMLAPMRRFIPMVGMIDITPLVAWLLLSLLQRVLGVP
jgi:YggT family protein